jgi:hypothetical protein
MPYMSVDRRPWDLAERTEAARLNLTEPAWEILYGLWERGYFAIARWDVPSGLIITARSLGSLRTLMRQAERPRRPAWLPAPTGDRATPYDARPYGRPT